MENISEISFLSDYHKVKTISSIDILKKFGIITRVEQINAENYMPNSLELLENYDDSFDENNLLGDDESDDFENFDEIIQEFSQATKNNRYRDVKTDFIEKSDLSLEPLLAKNATSDNFKGVIDSSNKFKNHYILVTTPSKSFKIDVKIGNIPHLVGLPNIGTIRTILNTKLNNYLISHGVDVNNYFDVISYMLSDDQLKGEWFDSLFMDLTNDDSIDYKDNTDKIGYKRACMQELLNSVGIGDETNVNYGGNPIMIYESSDKKRVMSIINIPNTDGYLGLICFYNEKKDNNGNIVDVYYTLGSVVALNEKEIKNQINVERGTFIMIDNGHNDSNVTDISKRGIIRYQNSQREQREKNNSSSVIYTFNDSYHNSSNKSSFYLKKELADATKEIKNNLKSNNKILAKRIIEILNKGYQEEDFRNLLPKYLLFIMITSDIKYEDFIYNMLSIINNCKLNRATLESLNFFYTISKNDYDNLIKYNKFNNEYELHIGIANNEEVSLNAVFRYSISGVNKDIPIVLTGYKSDLKKMKKQFNQIINNILNEILFDDNIRIKAYKNQNGKLNKDDFTNYSIIMKNIVGFQRFINASLNELKVDAKGRK